MMDLGWGEWLVIVAVLMLALKLGYDEILKRFRGSSQETSSNGSDDRNSARDMSGSSKPQVEQHPANRTPDHVGNPRAGMDRGIEEKAPIHITNIEIHDSVITRSTILGNGDILLEGDDGHENTPVNVKGTEDESE